MRYSPAFQACLLRVVVFIDWLALGEGVACPGPDVICGVA